MHASVGPHTELSTRLRVAITEQRMGAQYSSWARDGRVFPDLWPPAHSLVVDIVYQMLAAERYASARAIMGIDD